MKAVRELEQQGYEIRLKNGRVSIERKVGFDPDPEVVSRCIRGIREHRAKAVAYLQERSRSIRCPYHGEWRWITGAVCQWHREERDPECVRCGCKQVDWQDTRVTRLSTAA